jgi:hypothetical protein
VARIVASLSFCCRPAPVAAAQGAATLGS